IIKNSSSNVFISYSRWPQDRIHPARKYNSIQSSRYNSPTELIVKCRYWITVVSKFRNLV
ncbi:MAG TPA: hypothetical protein VK462_07645, partial [Nitrososphaeraceae archaeon]|nr:hypothetical protein [Nitrososphaeraceae archaeon]